MVSSPSLGHFIPPPLFFTPLILVLFLCTHLYTYFLCGCLYWHIFSQYYVVTMLKFSLCFALGNAQTYTLLLYRDKSIRSSWVQAELLFLNCYLWVHLFKINKDCWCIWCLGLHAFYTWAEMFQKGLTKLARARTMVQPYHLQLSPTLHLYKGESCNINISETCWIQLFFAQICSLHSCTKVVMQWVVCCPCCCQLEPGHFLGQIEPVKIGCRKTTSPSEWYVYAH